MRNQHWLGALQMSVGGHHRVSRALRLRRQRLRPGGKMAGNHTALLPHVEA